MTLSMSFSLLIQVMLKYIQSNYLVFRFLYGLLHLFLVSAIIFPNLMTYNSIITGYGHCRFILA